MAGLSCHGQCGSGRDAPSLTPYCLQQTRELISPLASCSIQESKHCSHVGSTAEQRKGDPASPHVVSKGELFLLTHLTCGSIGRGHPPTCPAHQCLRLVEELALESEHQLQHSGEWPLYLTIELAPQYSCAEVGELVLPPSLLL